MSRIEYRVVIFMRLEKEETDAIATLLLSDARVSGLMITPNEVPSNNKTVTDEGNKK